MTPEDFPPPLPHAGRAFGDKGPSLEELVLANKRHAEALIMYVNPDSRWPLSMQIGFLWIKRNLLRRAL